jgi:hypothetical protein
METAWADLLSDLTALSDALLVLYQNRSEEKITVDFSPTNNHGSSSSYSIRQFLLHRAAVTTYPDTSPTGYRLRVVCTAVGYDPKIFLYRDDLPSGAGDTGTPRPIAVCSPGDLVDFPEDEAGEIFPPLYRKNTFDFYTKDLSLIDETWSNIQRDVRDLADALRVHTDEVTETTIHGASYG